MQPSGIMLANALGAELRSSADEDENELRVIADGKRDADTPPAVLERCDLGCDTGTEPVPDPAHQLLLLLPSSGTNQMFVPISPHLRASPGILGLWQDPVSGKKYCKGVLPSVLTGSPVLHPVKPKPVVATTIAPGRWQPSISQFEYLNQFYQKCSRPTFQILTFLAQQCRILSQEPYAITPHHIQAWFFGRSESLQNTQKSRKTIAKKQRLQQVQRSNNDFTALTLLADMASRVKVP